VVPAVGLNYFTDLVDAQFEGCLFEGFLHVAFSEEAQVSSLLAAGALGVLKGDIFEYFRILAYLL
jgi:hypothetical protein